MFNIEDKLYISAEIENISSRIMYEKIRSVDDEQNLFWKYVIFVLDEAKINCENDRFMSLNPIFDEVAANGMAYLYNLDSPARKSILGQIKDLQGVIDFTLDNCLFSAFRREYELKALMGSFADDLFCKEIKTSPKLYEEFLNYVLNGCKFDGIELNEFCGYSAKRLKVEYDMTIIGAYVCLMEIEKNPKRVNEVLKKFLGASVNVC